MAVIVEFFGIPRARAGTAQTTSAGSTLAEVLDDLSRRLPALSETCFEGQRLRPGFAANLNGLRFVGDPATPLSDGDALLILSADAGG